MGAVVPAAAGIFDILNDIFDFLGSGQPAEPLYDIWHTKHQRSPVYTEVIGMNPDLAPDQQKVSYPSVLEAVRAAKLLALAKSAKSGNEAGGNILPSGNGYTFTGPYDLGDPCLNKFYVTPDSVASYHTHPSTCPNGDPEGVSQPDIDLVGEILSIGLCITLRRRRKSFCIQEKGRHSPWAIDLHWTCAESTREKIMGKLRVNTDLSIRACWLVLILAGIVLGRSDTGYCQEARAEPVSLVALIAEPNSYSGKRVVVTGYLVLKWETAALFLTPYDAQVYDHNAISLDLGNMVSQPHRELNESDKVKRKQWRALLDHETVDLEGTFYYPRKEKEQGDYWGGYPNGFLTNIVDIHRHDIHGMLPAQPSKEK